MPRTKTVTSKKKKVKNKAFVGTSAGARNNKNKTQPPSTTELMEAADRALQYHGDVDQAIALYSAALLGDNDKDIDGNNLRVCILEKRAEAKVSQQQVDEAKQDYRQALKYLQQQQHEQQHDGNNSSNNENAIEKQQHMASLLLYIGQLSSGHEALEAYQQGIQLLQSCLQQQQQQSTIMIQQQLSTLCCSAAEVYLTDLCYEENAEQACVALVNQALQQSSSSPTLDALQTAASLKLSQCQPVMAVHYMKQVYQQIQGSCQELARLVGMAPLTSLPSTNDNDHDGDADDSNKKPASVAAAAAAMELSSSSSSGGSVLPSFEFRCQTAKLLLECHLYAKDIAASATTADPNWNAAEAAVYVLGSLMAENDEVIEVWQLTGDATLAVASSSSNDGDEKDKKEQLAEALFYYQRTAEMLQETFTSLSHAQDEATTVAEEEELQCQIDEVTCQLELVQEKIINMKEQGIVAVDADAAAKPGNDEDMDDDNIDDDQEMTELC